MVFIAAFIIAIMCRAVMPWSAGNQKDKQAENSAGFWNKFAFPIAIIWRLFKVKKPRENDILKQAKNRSLTDIVTRSVSQVSELCCQLNEMARDLIASDSQFYAMVPQLIDQNTQIDV
jgi:hypothetical protein